MADYAISNVPRRVVYAASGVGPYAFTFEILAASDIAVYKGDTLLTLTTDYSVTINSNGTGSITLVASAGTSNITIVGSKTIARTTDFTTGGDFFANTLNDELDAQTIFIQQVAETAERGMKAPVTDPTDINMTLPRKADRAGKYLAFDANGNPEPGPTSSDVASVAAIASEIVTVAGIASDVTSVAAIDTAVSTVATNVGSVNSVASSITNVNTTATNITNVNAVGADLLEPVSEINTVAVNIGDVNTVGTNISNVNTVASNTTNINTVAGDSADINTVAAISTDVSTVADIAVDVTTVSIVATDVTTVATNIANVNTVASDLNEPVSEINTVATNITNVNAVGTDIANVNTCATNMAAIIDAPNQAAAAAASAAAAAASYDNFDDRYLGVKTADPTLDNDGNALVAGALYFNSGAVTPADKGMYVYDGAVWIPASAASSAILVVYQYTATAGQTTFSGSDNNSLTLAYTAGSAIVTLNGVILEVPSEVTASSGSSVVLASGAAAGDELNVYAFATFDIANVYTKAETDAFAVKLTGNQSIAGNKNFAGDTLYVDDTNDRVGVGTASPLGKLAVVSNTGITGYGSLNSPTLTVHASNRVANQEQQIFTVFTTDTPTVDFGGSIGLGGRSASASGDANAYAQIAGRKENSTNANYAGYLQFSTSDVASDLTERMRINSSGDVSIGTNNSNGRLLLASASGNVALSLQPNTSSGNYAYYSTDGTYAYIASSSGTTGLKLKVALTAPDNAMTLDSSGRTLYNTTQAPYNNGQFGTNYGTSYWSFGGQSGTGTFIVQNGSSATGVYIAAGNTSWTGTSDGRLKDIVGPIDNGLNKVLAMNPVKYTWKSDENEVKDIHLGFIAQDMQSIEPDIVEQELNGNLGITYTEIIPILTKAIQEQQAMIQELNAKVTALEEQVINLGVK